MKIGERLRQCSTLFLDSAPVIYYIEVNTAYRTRTQVAFDLVDEGVLGAVTSPVTLAECLVLPKKLNRDDLAQAYAKLILTGVNTTFVPIGDAAARYAAELRARYGMPLADAFQCAAALGSGCDGFLTNDVALKRVRELNVIVLDDFEAE